MRHVIVTLDEPANTEAMRSIPGAKLVHTEDGYCVYYCKDLSQAEIDAIRLNGLILLNKPA
jgi:hypothetical protein